MNTLPNYRIYPSLLDKYQSLLDYEQEADTPWNRYTARQIEQLATSDNPPAELPDEGDYILTPDEMYDKIERELIDSINRVPHEPSQAASRGTALNEIIDCMLLNQPCQRDDMQIRTVTTDAQVQIITASLDGFEFSYDANFCRTLRDQLRGSLCQLLIEAPITTNYGTVQLYGYIDYWLRDHVIDLKTTSRYEWGKYQRKWQRHVYPYCCIASGLTDEVTDFTYLAAQLGRGNVITGTLYPEVYTYNHEQSTKLLQMQLNSFIEWLESRRDLITDTKIFNLHEQTA